MDTTFIRTTRTLHTLLDMGTVVGIACTLGMGIWATFWLHRLHLERF